MAEQQRYAGEPLDQISLQNDQELVGSSELNPYDEILQKIKSRHFTVPSANYLQDHGFYYAAVKVEDFRTDVAEFINSTDIVDFRALPDFIAKPNLDAQPEPHPYTKDRLLEDLEYFRSTYGVFMLCTEVGGGAKLVGKAPAGDIEQLRSLIEDLQSRGYQVGLGFNDHSFMTKYRSPRVGSLHTLPDGSKPISTIYDNYGMGLFAAARHYQEKQYVLVNGRLRPARIANADDIAQGRVSFRHKGVALVIEDEEELAYRLQSMDPEEYARLAENFNYRVDAGKVDELPVTGWRRQSFDVVGSGQFAKYIHDKYGASEEGLQEWLNFLVRSAAILSKGHHMYQEILEEEMELIISEGFTISEDTQTLIKSGYGLRLGEWLDIIHPDIWAIVADQAGQEKADELFERFNRKVSEITALMSMTFRENTRDESETEEDIYKRPETIYAATNFPILEFDDQGNEVDGNAVAITYNYALQGILLSRRSKNTYRIAEDMGALLSAMNFQHALGHSSPFEQRHINVTERSKNPLYTFPQRRKAKAA